MDKQDLQDEELTLAKNAKGRKEGALRRAN